MSIAGRIRTVVRKVHSEADRQKVLAVLAATYQAEKDWIDDPETQFPPEHLGRDNLSWFLVKHRGEPVGVLRVLYDPPLAQYLKYGLEPIDPSFRVETLIAGQRIAEVGRFAVVPEGRRRIEFASGLIRAATREVVAKGYTQLVTDVFEHDQHSPYGFHTRVLGFQPVATHQIGELRSRSRRITLVLDIKAAYNRLKARRDRFFRHLTRGWTLAMHRRLAV